MKFLNTILLTMVFYFSGAQIDPRDISKWEKVGNLLFPKDYANESVVIGTNTNMFQGGNFRFLATEGRCTTVVSDKPGNVFVGNIFIDTNVIRRIDITDSDAVIESQNTNLGLIGKIQTQENKIDIDVEDTTTNELSNIDIDKLIISSTVADPVKNVNIQHTKEKFEINLVDNSGPPLNYVLKYNLNGLSYYNGLGDLFRVQNTVVSPSPLFASLPSYDDDAAAGAAGLVTGEMYQTTGAGAAPLNVPGIVMVKQ